MSCECCDNDCVSCLCDPPSVNGLDLILFGGECDECYFPLGVRIPLPFGPVNFPLGQCVGWGVEPVDLCPWCWMSQTGPEMSSTASGCKPRAALHCIRGHNEPFSYGLLLSGLGFGGPSIQWAALTVDCDPFEVTFDDSFGMIVFPSNPDGCAGSYPTSAVVVPHV